MNCCWPGAGLTTAGSVLGQCSRLTDFTEQTHIVFHVYESNENSAFLASLLISGVSAFGEVPSSNSSYVDVKYRKTFFAKFPFTMEKN